MKAYEKLNVEVVRFEAQDVITASVAAPVKCTCSIDTRQEHNIWVVDESGNTVIDVDHTRGNNPCYAEEHPNCHLIN